jgi:hypothetical protein
MYRPDSYSPEKNEYAYVEEFHFPPNCECDVTPTSQTDPRFVQTGPYGFYSDGTVASRDIKCLGAHGSETSNPRSMKYTYFTLDPNSAKTQDANANTAA